MPRKPGMVAASAYAKARECLEKKKAQYAKALQRAADLEKEVNEATNAVTAAFNALAPTPT